MPAPPPHLSLALALGMSLMQERRLLPIGLSEEPGGKERMADVLPERAGLD